MKKNQYYKLARPDGWDFYSGKTINYRESIGKRVKCPTRFSGTTSKEKQTFILCSADVLHACLNPNDCFVGAKIPCSAYLIEGKSVIDDGKKFGFRELKVIREIKDLDKLFGFKYMEAIDPIHPFRLGKKQPTKEDIRLLKYWASVRDSVKGFLGNSVWDSVGDSVGDSVWDSVRDSVWKSVGDSVWDSVWHSVWNSVGNSVRNSVGDSLSNSVWAYIGSLFPNIKKWRYIIHKEGEYPFQSAIDLWKRGFIASFDGKLWRLHSGRNAKVVYEWGPYTRKSKLEEKKNANRI